MIWNGSYMHMYIQARIATPYLLRCSLTCIQMHTQNRTLLENSMKSSYGLHGSQSPAGIPVDPSARSNSFINPQALDQCTVWTRSQWPLAYYNMMQISRCTAAHRHTVWHSWHGHGEGEQPRLLFGITDGLHALVTRETSKAMNAQCHGLQGV